MRNINFQKIITNELYESIKVKTETVDTLTELIEDITKLIIKRVKKGGKILIVGNGGSAADAQHIAADFVGKFRFDISIPAVALTTDTSILTSLSNDYHFNFVFSKQIGSLGSVKDVLIAISTSGSSRNILEAMKTAKEKGLAIIAFTSQTDRNMYRIADITVAIPSRDVARAQEAHITIGHILCHIVKRYFNDESHRKQD